MSGVEFVDIPFGAYLPDFGGMPNPDMPGYLVDAVGVRPTPNGYRGTPIFSTIASTNAIGGASSTLHGAHYEVSASVRRTFAYNYNDAKIYASADYGVSAWSDVTPAAGAALNYPGNFFSFGSDVVYVCPNRVPISRSLSAAIGTAFADLAGSPPQSYSGARVRQHAVLGGLVGNEYALQWSAIGTHTDWPTPGSTDALAKEAGSQTLPSELGYITAILGGEKIGIAVQQRGLTRMTYEGGNTVFAFDTFETKIGSGNEVANRRNGFVTDGKLWYWQNSEGFFVTDGYSVNRIDDGKYQDAIVNDLISHPLATHFPATYVQGAYDPHRHLVVFSSSFTGGAYLFYLDIDTGNVFWDSGSLGNPFNGITTGLTSQNSGQIAFNIDGNTRKLQTLTGSGATVAIQTGFIEIDPGYAVQLEGAHLIGANGIGSLTIAYKAVDDYTSMSVAQTGFTSLTDASRGMKKQARATGQFFAFRTTGTGAESQLLKGLRVYYSRAQPSP